MRTLHIGEVANRVGLSLRTVRYYEQVDLVPPSGRTQGGFRLYSDADIERLNLVKAMKPMGFTLEEMRDLMAVRDGATTGADPQTAERLAAYATLAAERCERLRAKLEQAEAFTRRLEAEASRAGAVPPGP